jgi:hypothetical protein
MAPNSWNLTWKRSAAASLGSPESGENVSLVEYTGDAAAVSTTATS